MPTTQMAAKLTDYGTDLAVRLGKLGLVANIDPESYRDWTVKLRVSGAPLLAQETVNLYSNGKGKTSFKLHEASPGVRDFLDAALKGEMNLPTIATPLPLAAPTHGAGTEKAAELEVFCKDLCTRLETKGFKAQLDPLSFKNYAATIELFDGPGDPLRISIHTNAKDVFHGKYDKVPEEKRERIREEVDNQIANLPDGIVIFVDGSYDKETKRGGYGVRVLNSSRKVFDLAGPVEKPEGDNIAGEIRGVLRALDWARKAGAKEVQIRHDYKGLHYWIFPDPETGKTWKNNTPDGQMYAAKVREHLSSGLKLNYLKVIAHAGDIHNEAVDVLAKEGVRIEKERIQYYRKPLDMGPSSPAPAIAEPARAQTQPTVAMGA